MQKISLLPKLYKNIGIRRLIKESETIVPGLYRNIKNRKLYEVIGTGRSVDEPEKLLIIYRQKYNSKLRGTNINLSIDSIWTRDYREFMEKFVKE